MERAASERLPDPQLRLVFRIEATLGEALEIGETSAGRRRIVPIAGGSFEGPELSGTVISGAGADWQIVRPDGTALGDIRLTLRTQRGDLLDLRSRSIRHGPAEVLSRLARGEDVAPNQYTFRTATAIEAAASDLEWLNKGVFIGVGARRPGGVIYETYLVS